MLGALLQALQTGLTNESHINASVRRALEKRFLTGQFDPLQGQMHPIIEKNPKISVDIFRYTKIGMDAINSTASNAFNLDATLQGLILLKNQNNALPWSRGIFVLHPKRLFHNCCFPKVKR